MLPLRKAPRAARALLVAGLAAMSGPQAMPAEPATGFDLSRYSGRWYVIAHAPAARDPAVGAYFEYRPRGDGAIDRTYSARERSFGSDPVTTETVVRADPRQPAKWSVRRGWFSSDEEWVLYVSAGYRAAIAGTPDREEAWILARDPVIPEWTYAGLLARLALQGYDVSRFRRVAQQPEQVGRPGFE